MSKAQLVVTAVVFEGRSKSEVARDYASLNLHPNLLWQGSIGPTN